MRDLEILTSIIENKCIYVPFILWLLIQIYKVIFDLITTKKFNFRRIMGAGGMPSSHAAAVCSLSVLIGRTEGFDSSIFGLSLIFALIVMYDAAGVRRAAGKQARVLNKMIETPNMSTLEVQEKLVEFLGHTPIEVFVGALVGIIAGCIF